MKDFLVWIDIETTGLDHYVDQILEIAVIITDSSFNEIERLHYLVAKPIMSMLPVVEKMHTASGLLDDLNKIHIFKSLDRLDEEMSLILEASVVSHMYQKGLASIYPAGSSVHFDMNFIRRDFPKLYSMMHHRYFDVSSIMLAYKFALGKRFASKSPKIQPEHRAMNDIQSSLNFAKRYCKFSLTNTIKNFFSI